MEADTCSPPLINHLRRSALPRRGGTAPVAEGGLSPVWLKGTPLSVAATWVTLPAPLNAVGFWVLQERGWQSFTVTPHTGTATP